ncbi:DUF2892 family protein [Hypnocyclicus thermotrophus]|uniref:DUF2892 family protein n=1 Tax=Hypnocyclicus thermotrophus TaxID=1627895 RepID=A0AA46I5U4_9FUSO|nr:DUF2892 domain-containing protein [Hypnocyclicus thermotrophus]TDT71489.1 DUF2892 family protein [Hypnocyclicus thermotrophus]
MKKNEGKLDRIIRIVIGVIFLLISFISSGILFWISLILGIISLVTGILGWCGLYQLFGINTCKIDDQE